MTCTPCAPTCVANKDLVARQLYRSPEGRLLIRSVRLAHLTNEIAIEALRPLGLQNVDGLRVCAVEFQLKTAGWDQGFAQIPLH